MFDLETLKANLIAKGYEVSCFDTAEEAADYLDAQIDQKSVGFGGSMTLKQMGLYARLNRHNTVYWHWEPGQRTDAQATAALYELFCEKFYEEKPFATVPLIFHVKKEGPASRAQKERLQRLAALYKTQLPVDVEMLTRNEASRLADQLIARYGKVPQTVENPEKARK